jgi:peptidoglycan/xylan/chitin deacetylase (PgdA/CDA1 family)
LELNVKNILSSLASSVLPTLFSTTDRLSILIYHRVLPVEDFMRPNEPTVDTFNWQMELISKYFSPLSLVDALALAKEGKLPKNAICVTFDDGYADNEEYALPILKKWKIPATVFVSTGFMNGGCMWNDTVIESLRHIDGRVNLDSIGLGTYKTETETQKRESAFDIISRIKHMESSERLDVTNFIKSICPISLPADLMLDNNSLMNLVKSGVEIGGHTVNHPILAKLSNEEALKEIEEGKDVIERITNQRVRYFAYPNGKLNNDYLIEQSVMVKNMGFEAAVTTEWGVSSSISDKYQLARFTPWDKTPEKFLIRLLLNQRNLVT